jgi:hypothetical protein
MCSLDNKYATSSSSCLSTGKQLYFVRHEAHNTRAVRFQILCTICAVAILLHFPLFTTLKSTNPLPCMYCTSLKFDQALQDPPFQLCYPVSQLPGVGAPPEPLHAPGAFPGPGKRLSDNQTRGVAFLTLPSIFQRIRGYPFRAKDTLVSSFPGGVT